MSSCLFKLCPVTDLLIRPAGSISTLILSDGTSPAATNVDLSVGMHLPLSAVRKTIFFHSQRNLL